MSESRYLSITEAADHLGCHKDTIRRLIARGELPAVRIGKSRVIRIAGRNLDRLLKPVTPLSQVVAND